jgi:molybdate transport system substrate-binding protein
MSTNADIDHPSLSLFSALVIQGAIKETILPAYKLETGTEVVTSFDPTFVLMERIAKGERADILVAISSNIDELIATGILSPNGRIELVSTGVGLAVISGASQPNISSVSELKKTLLNARSVAYSLTGASGIYFGRLLDELGIAELVNEKATIITKGLIAESLLDGSADIAVQQLSELKTVPGVDVIGPLPEPVQHTTLFSAAIFAHAVSNPNSAKLLSALNSNKAKDAYRAYGLSISE